jgi:hypothetical protein
VRGGEDEKGRNSLIGRRGPIAKFSGMMKRGWGVSMDVYESDGLIGG